MKTATITGLCVFFLAGIALIMGGAIRHSVEVGEEKRCMSCTVPHCTTCNCLGFCRRCDSSFHLFFGKCWNPDCAECHTRFCKECGCDGKCRVCKWGPVLTGGYCKPKWIKDSPQSDAR